MKGRGITKVEREEIKRLTTLLMSENMPIPQKVMSFFKRVEKAPGTGDRLFVDYITKRHNRLMFRKFAITTPSYRDPKASLTEIMRGYADGKPVMCNYHIAWGYMGGTTISIHRPERITTWNKERAFIDDPVHGKYQLYGGYVVNEAEALEKFGKYSEWETYHKERPYGLSMFEYLAKYQRYPEMEFLVKAGFIHLAEQPGKIKGEGKSFSTIFGVDKRWEETLKRADSATLISIIKRHPWAKDEIELQRIRNLEQAFSQKGLRRAELTTIGNAVGDERLFRYLMEQEDEKSFYRVVSDYGDAAREMLDAGYPLDRKHFLPKEFDKLHDEVMSKKAARLERVKQEGFLSTYNKAIKYAFEESGFIIRPVRNEDELIAESAALQHCVRSYAQQVVDGMTMIFLIRQVEQPEQPFVTLELKGRKIVQNRGEHNHIPSEETLAFIDTWAKKFKLQNVA